MIKITKGNCIEANAEALVNTVNCVGVMGKGIALQSKRAFPDNYNAYLKECRKGNLKPGRMFVFKNGSMLNPKFIINFPTKQHWIGRSRYEDIEAGLEALVDEVRNNNIQSIAIPPLGCGLGGLDWRKVRPMIEKALASIDNIQVYLYEPSEYAEDNRVPIAAKEPKMTIARALLIKLMQQYNSNAYRLTLLEIQKLAYFLQEAGEELRLNYIKHTYGPFAYNLDKMLELLEGHLINGYRIGDKPDMEISLLPGAVKKADVYLNEHPHALSRLEEVSNLVEGFETPYGMELLSSVHWIVVHDKTAKNSEEAIAQIAIWNDRKKRLFRPEHIHKAWARIIENT